MFAVSKTMTESELLDAIEGASTLLVVVNKSNYAVSITRETALEMREALHGYIKVEQVGKENIVIVAT